MAINNKFPIVKCFGTATLVAGVATVAEVQVAVGDVVMCSMADPAGSTGIPTVAAADVTAGQFIIRSMTPGGTTAQTSDTSKINYVVITG